MTPSFCWVFLLALVGRAASVPDPIVVDACALVCNPGAETESEQARDPNLYPQYPKVNCHPQSVSDADQAWRIASYCLKLCNIHLSLELEVNCFALRSSLESNLGCYCDALTPLSPNTMRLHESWRLNFLVKELAKDIMTVILESPLDMIILCEIHKEIYKGYTLELPNRGKIIDICNNETMQRMTRSIDEDLTENGDVEKDVIEEIVADEEVNDCVACEKLENNNKNYEKDTQNFKKNNLETEEKKFNHEKDTDKRKKDEVKNNMENKKKVEKDVTDDSKTDSVKDSARIDAKHSKDHKKDSKNDNEGDNVKTNAKNIMENNKKNTINNAKNIAQKKTTNHIENNEKKDKVEANYGKMDRMDYVIDETLNSEPEMMNDKPQKEEKEVIKETLSNLIEKTNYLVKVLNSLISKLEKNNELK